MTTETTRPRVALATCSVLPHLDPDDAPLIGALAERGVDAEPAVWDDESVDWSGFDAVVLRSTWDYSARRDDFVAWAARVPHLLNPEPVVRWNTDKGYLRELDAHGVPVIPTLWLDPERNLSSRAIHTRLPAQGDFVIKPVVSAGANDTGRYQSGEAYSRGLAIQHAKALLVSGRQVMVQPYIRSVDTAGETCIVFIDGEFSHALRKNALLTGPHRPTQGLYKQEEMRRHEATEAEIDVARRALEVAAKAVPGDGPYLYARVDLVVGDNDVPTVIELELTEPSLFFGFAPGALDRFADAVAARVTPAG
ncbi:ATP-grasp domain-containing protein [Oerskovia flava]|uniref:ATP-grasp domain-containing protein n=1 Tax=Oerskovia flava TaxID=2986422 RepID=UPI00223F1899|nr:hypothetical protein [Oerskovia sp. JB1-3-2]